jgi:chromosome segregation ATPase
MTLITTNHSDNLTTLKTSKMQSTTISNRLMLGLAAFSVSFGLSLVPNWDFTKAFVTGIITVLSTYSAALFVDKRRRIEEIRIFGSLHRKIRELEGLKSRIIHEVQQLEEYQNILYKETQQLQNQIAECRSQRDSLHRDIGTLAGQKKQVETEINNFTNEIQNLENDLLSLNNSCTNLNAEKRRLEVTCNASRTEISQLQTQIEAFQQEKQEVENNLTLLGRLKPQLEEKLYELRIEIQQLEIAISQGNQSLADTKTAQEKLETQIKSLETDTTTKQTEIQQLESQISLLQDERDLLQNQVWDLLHQLETLNTEQLSNSHNAVVELDEDIDDIEFFPFDELLQPVESFDSPSQKLDHLPQEWNNFFQKLPEHEIQVLKAIAEQDNPKATIKQIAEAHITMPNLLIDAINEIANDTIGELIIDPGTETPEIFAEHLLNVQKIIHSYENLNTKSVSAN